ncbi:MAG: 2Fe-2S iron-sulfur cluster-binding protein, partial [Pseudomonadota bacterium]
MAHRLQPGGRLIDRSAPRRFSFNGKGFSGFAGDTLASALLASDQMLMGRSFKYHRPRGAVARGHEEPNALMNLGQGAFFEPNQRATVTPLSEGLEAESQNHWPSLESDVGAVNGLLGRFLPAGFYYKTFIHPRPAWKHLFEPFIRQSAGLGKAPKDPDGDDYEILYRFCDVLIAGGGVAGLTAALRAGAEGKRVLLLEQSPVWGGRAATDMAQIDGRPAAEWIAETVARLEAMENVSIHTGVMVSGLYDHGYVLAAQPVPGFVPGKGGLRERLWRIRAAEVVAATGAIERPLSFAGNDIPGVMLAGAVRDYLADFGVVIGQRTAVVTNNDDAYRTALALKAAGQLVPVIVDARPESASSLVAEAIEAGIRIAFASAVVEVAGTKRVTGIRVAPQAGDGAGGEEIACDAVAMSGGWSPAVHLFSQAGGKLVWDEAQALFRPDPKRAATGADGMPFVFAVGTANGHLETGQAMADAAGDAIPEAEENPIAPVWRMPAQAPVKLREKTWLDFQNDVKVSDVQLAAREGFESVEHAKRYTTLGMASDQGKLSNINGLAVLGEALGKEIPQVGTTTFRPPFVPLSMGTIAGEARGDLFQPLRKTPMDGWHAAHGAHWEPVGQWRRPYCFLRGSETAHDAVNREVLNTRQNVGLLDASTLGKIMVKGPDAGRFLDMIYTNMMSSLGIGRCRYGLMCSENGFLIDDGVVARIDKDTWLCHTTTGGADHIHAQMEDWLQCEWWDWQVWTQNLTEQYAQIAVVGPQARVLLDRLGGMDLSAEALPFMRWADGQMGGIPARVFRISFSGELSFEVAVPAGRGLELWEALNQVGQGLGVMPYGTEALHVLRAEKGFIMIGDETDGTVIPQDLGLDWAIS